MRRDFDVVIVGGGLVGAGLAIALRSMNMHVALIDARKENIPDQRLFALNAATCNFIENINLWDALEMHRTVINEVHVSKQGHFGAIRLRSEDMSLPVLGYLIPAARLEEVMHQALLDLPSLTLFRPAVLEKIESAHPYVLTLNHNDQKILIRAPIIIGADGANSIVRHQMGIETETIDYQQHAIVTETILRNPHQHKAYERFTKQGTIAILPLKEKTCATIWSGATSDMQRLMGLSANDFVAELQRRFGYRLGAFEGCTKRYIFPLQMVRAKQNYKDGVLIIGNAAHTMHPIAAQGFNLAIYEVAALVNRIQIAKKSGQVLTRHVIEEVARQLEKTVQQRVDLTNRLVNITSTPSFFTNFSMQFGMLTLEKFYPLKRFFLKNMMGRTQCVPPLLVKTPKSLNANGI